MIDRSFGALVCAFVLTCPDGLAGSHASDVPFPRHLGRSVNCEPVGRCDVSAGNPRPRPTATPPESSIAAELSGCSPFYGIDGYRELDFDPAKGVATETIDPPPGGVGARNATPIEIAGTFSVKAHTGRVVVTIGGVRREYALVVPVDSAQCILAFGDAKAVDLERSWFAAVTDEPDADPPDYQQAARRVLHPDHAVTASGSSVS